MLTWTGFTDLKTEGTFQNVINGAPVIRGSSFWPFTAGESNGDRKENCAVTYIGKWGWNDLMCGSLAYGYCRMQARQRFKIRGIKCN